MTFPVGSFVVFHHPLGVVDPHAFGTVVGLSLMPDRVYVYWGIGKPLLEMTANLLRCSQIEHENNADWLDNQ